jgi:hypothetical protein
MENSIDPDTKESVSNLLPNPNVDENTSDFQLHRFESHVPYSFDTSNPIQHDSNLFLIPQAILSSSRPDNYDLGSNQDDRLPFESLTNALIDVTHSTLVSMNESAEDQAHQTKSPIQSVVFKQDGEQTVSPMGTQLTDGRGSLRARIAVNEQNNDWEYQFGESEGNESMYDSTIGMQVDVLEPTSVRWPGSMLPEKSPSLHENDFVDVDTVSMGTQEAPVDIQDVSVYSQDVSEYIDDDSLDAQAVSVDTEDVSVYVADASFGTEDVSIEDDSAEVEDASLYAGDVSLDANACVMQDGLDDPDQIATKAMEKTLKAKKELKIKKLTKLKGKIELTKKERKKGTRPTKKVVEPPKRKPKKAKVQKDEDVEAMVLTANSNKLPESQYLTQKNKSKMSGKNKDDLPDDNPINTIVCPINKPKNLEITEANNKSGYKPFNRNQIPLIIRNYLTSHQWKKSAKMIMILTQDSRLYGDILLKTGLLIFDKKLHHRVQHRTEILSELEQFNRLIQSIAGKALRPVTVFSLN